MEVLVGNDRDAAASAMHKHVITGMELALERLEPYFPSAQSARKHLFAKAILHRTDRRERIASRSLILLCRDRRLLNAVRRLLLEG